jgi:hypothetical protein
MIDSERHARTPPLLFPIPYYPFPYGKELSILSDSKVVSQLPLGLH